MVSIRVVALLVLSMIQAAPVRAQSERETIRVIETVLDSVFTSQGDRAPVMLVFDSLFHREFDPGYDEKLSQVVDPAIDKETIADFYAKSARNVLFPKGVTNRRLKLLSMTEINQMDLAGRELEAATKPGNVRDAGYWYLFTKRFPEAWGMTFLSAVGFNTRRSQALIYLRHQCGASCSNREVIFLVKNGSRWRVAKRIPMGTYERRPEESIGSLRSMAADAHLIADMKFEERERADSIRRDALPRKIRGRVVNRETGLAMGRMRVVLYSSSSAGIDSSRSVTTNLRGEYTIENPRIGGLLLLVRCPAPNLPREDLWGAGAPVHQQTDTVVDIVVDNIRPCWQRRIHPLESGELTSVAYQQSVAPSAVEAKIYSALLDDTSIVHAERARILVDALTWAECEEECGYQSLGYLVPGKSEDSTTVSDFRVKLTKRSRLNPAAMSAIHVSLLPWAERGYLTEEGALLRGPKNGQPQSGFWLAVRTVHPSTDAVISFTHAGFDSDRTHALVALRIQTGEDAYTDETVLMEETGNTWRVVKRHLEKD